MSYRIAVNGECHVVTAAPETPPLYMLQNDLGMDLAFESFP
jgi:hypothetical protein